MSMREIKFRVWDIEKKRFHHPKLWDNTMPSNWEYWYILQQYTGLKDKNGVEIYEGDLVGVLPKDKYEETTFNCFEVFHHDNECIGGQNIGFCINRMHSQGNSAGGRGFKFTPESMKSFEIIGNIYENPELLETRGE